MNVRFFSIPHITFILFLTLLNTAVEASKRPNAAIALVINLCEVKLSKNVLIKESSCSSRIGTKSFTKLIDSYDTLFLVAVRDCSSVLKLTCETALLSPL